VNNFLPVLHESEALLAVVGKFLVGADKRHAACDGLGNDDVVEWVVVVWSRPQVEQRAHHVQVDGQDVNLESVLNVSNQSISRVPSLTVEVLVPLFDDDFAHALNTHAQRVVEREHDVFDPPAQSLPFINHEQEDVGVEHVSH